MASQINRRLLRASARGRDRLGLKPVLFLSDPTHCLSTPSLPTVVHSDFRLSTPCFLPLPRSMCPFAQEFAFHKGTVRSARPYKRCERKRFIVKLCSIYRKGRDAETEKEKAALETLRTAVSSQRLEPVVRERNGIASASKPKERHGCRTFTWRPSNPSTTYRRPLHIAHRTPVGRRVLGGRLAALEVFGLLFLYGAHRPRRTERVLSPARSTVGRHGGLGLDVLLY